MSSTETCRSLWTRSDAPERRSLLMKRMLLGVSMVAAMLFAASSALAGGVNLAWTNCLNDGGVQSRINACANNLGSASLVASFTPDQDITGVTGIEAVVDFL